MQHTGCNRLGRLCTQTRPVHSLAPIARPVAGYINGVFVCSHEVSSVALRCSLASEQTDSADLHELRAELAEPVLVGTRL
jgi:hypothetical protein